MAADLKDLPFADSVPHVVRRVFAQAELLHEASEVERAVDRVAVRLTVELQDKNPVLVNVLPVGFVFAGMLLRRLIFPLQFVSVALLPTGKVDAPEDALQLLREREVVLIDGPCVARRNASLRQWVTEAGAVSVRNAFMIADQAQPVSDRDYVALVGDAGEAFGSGLDYQGYGANLPGIYTIGGT